MGRTREDPPLARAQIGLKSFDDGHELQAEDSEGLRTRLRTLVDEIRLVPADGGLRVEVRGALGGILRLASGDAPGQMVGAVPDMFDLQFKMDAGTGFEPVTFRL